MNRARKLSAQDVATHCVVVAVRAALFFTAAACFVAAVVFSL